MIRPITLAVLLGFGVSAFAQNAAPVELPKVVVTPDRIGLWIDQLSREIIADTESAAELPRLPLPQVSAGDCGDKDKDRKDSAMLS